jgi:metal-dependent amidase/aminoacylase/carboxypeptidase family protein
VFRVDLHQNPELSQQEQKTSAKMAARRASWADIHRARRRYGVVGV